MILDKDFTLNKYGLYVRFVEESDAEFILNLRTDPKLGQFLHTTDNDVEKQREWIREYKNREMQGLDYYFIYFKDGLPIGVNRIYDINNDSATGGSWVCSPNIDFELPIITVIILREIMFDILHLDYDYFDVRKENKKVNRMHKIFGAIITSCNELDNFYTLSKANFEANKQKMLTYINE